MRNKKAKHLRKQARELGLARVQSNVTNPSEQEQDTKDLYKTFKKMYRKKKGA